MGISRVPAPDELLRRARRALRRDPYRAAALTLEAAASAGLHLLASAGRWRPCMTQVDVVAEAQEVLDHLAPRDRKARQLRTALDLALGQQIVRNREGVAHAIGALREATAHLNEIRAGLHPRRSVLSGARGRARKPARRRRAQPARA